MNAQHSRIATVFLLLSAVFLGPDRTLAQTALQVEPGLTISDSSIPWALETYQSKRQLVPFHRSDPSVNSHVAQTLLFSPKMSIELRGANSANQLHDVNPCFYLYVDPDQDRQGIGSNVEGWSFTLVRALHKGSKRIIETLSVPAFSGSKVKSTVIESDIVRMPDHWYRIQPKAPLQPGEYILLATWKSANDSRRPPTATIWDFGINPSAPNEADAVSETRK
ncbi:MAG TPA: hypothetical protein VF865_11250 [Acidobacteriaceae bacterium]